MTVLEVIRRSSDFLARKGVESARLHTELLLAHVLQMPRMKLYLNFDRPIADLNLSVRARKCMIRLGINSISELVRRTGDDLLECKNFGVTSLTEVREKLTTLGLKLRGD